MKALLIHDPGPATTVQDFGRPGARRWGVPESGTLRPDWLRLANALVGNASGAAALELRLMGPRFEVAGDDGLRVAAGGPVELKVMRADGTHTVPAWQSVELAPGDRVATGRVHAGTTALLAVAGGIDVPPVLDSRATYARAGLGGIAGRALAAGDRVPVRSSPAREPQALPDPPVDDDSPIRVVLGPQDDHFTQTAREALLSQPFTITDQVDRMGMRLSGPRLTHLNSAEIASDGIVPGAIQVPGNGAPIVLLADGQTVGGYPKIATVVRGDLGRLATMAPGAQVRFRAVSVAQAEDLLAQRAAALAQAIAGIRPVHMQDGIDLLQLYETNLVAGAVDGARPDNFPGHLEGTQP